MDRGKRMFFCNICGYEGQFRAFGRRQSAQCRHCGSLERTRFMVGFLDWVASGHGISAQSVLELAPTVQIRDWCRDQGMKHSGIDFDPDTEKFG